MAFAKAGKTRKEEGVEKVGGVTEVEQRAVPKKRFSMKLCTYVHARNQHEMR